MFETFETSLFPDLFRISIFGFRYSFGCGISCSRCPVFKNVLLILLFFLFISSLFGDEQFTGWTSIRGSPDCKGTVEWTAKDGETLQEWHFKPDPDKSRRYKQDLAVWASPAVSVINGTPIAFIGGADQTMHAIDLKNKIHLWSKISNAEIANSPVVADVEGRKILFWGSSDRTLYANDALTGDKIWTKELVPPSNTLGNFQVSSPLFINGRLFICFFAYDKSLARNSQKAWLMEIGTSDGSTRWKYEISQGPVNSPNGIEIDGKIIVCTVARKGLMQAFDVTDGNPILLWKFQMPHEVLGSPCICRTDSRTMVFLGSKYGNLIAVDALNGKELWQRMAGNWIDNTVCAGKVGKTHMVVAGSYDYNVYAYDAEDGSLIWKTPVGGEVYSAPCLVNGNGEIIVAALNNHIYVLGSKYGNILTSYFTGNPVWDKIAKGETLWGSPAVVDAGGETSLIHGSYSGTVYLLPLAKECSLQATARSAKGLWISLLLVAVVFLGVILPVTIKLK